MKLIFLSLGVSILGNIPRQKVARYDIKKIKNIFPTKRILLGCPRSLETIDAQGFLFDIISSNYVRRFCSVEINTATFHRLGFTFIRRCTAVRNTFAKERHFPDNLT